jgi:hypothetical protein
MVRDLTESEIKIKALEQQAERWLDRLTEVGVENDKLQEIITLQNTIFQKIANVLINKKLTAEETISRLQIELSELAFQEKERTA